MNGVQTYYSAMSSRGTEIDMNAIYRYSDHVAYREVEGDILIVPIRMSVSDPTGIYRLNRTASFIWKQFNGKQTVHHIIEQVVARFDVALPVATHDMRTLLNDLLSFDALVVAPRK